MYVCPRASVHFAQGSIQLDDDQEIIQIKLVDSTTTDNHHQFGVVQGMISFAVSFVLGAFGVEICPEFKFCPIGHWFDAGGCSGFY